MTQSLAAETAFKHAAYHYYTTPHVLFDLVQRNVAEEASLPAINWKTKS